MWMFNNFTTFSYQILMQFSSKSLNPAYDDSIFSIEHEGPDLIIYGYKRLYSINIKHLPNATWCHIAITVNNINKKTSIYIDGIEYTDIQGSSIYTNFSSIWPFLEIGFTPLWPDDRFNGKLADIRFYSKDLSSTQILKIYTDSME
jgi:hypothetical protein